jgi:hypothetical protein
MTERPDAVCELFTERLFSTEEMRRPSKLDQYGVRRTHADRGTKSKRHVRYGCERPFDSLARDAMDLELRNECARLGDALPFEHAIAPSHAIDGDEPLCGWRSGWDGVRWASFVR